MNIKIITLAFASFFPAAVFAQTWPQVNQEAKPGLRWWWLGSAVNKSDLNWNMSEYSKVGAGALEITPIYGVKNNESNELNYLSPEWMDMLKYVQETGKDKGLLIDMNGGTGWPFGGPTVSIEHAAAKLAYTDKTAAGKLLRKGIDINLEDPKEKAFAKLSKVMAFASDGVVDITDKADCEGVLTWKEADKKKTYRIIAVYCSRTRQKVKRAAPGGEGYVLDHFDKQAVKEYLNHFETAFAQTNTPYPHSFFSDSYEVYKANWTPRLFEEFEKRRGYKLEEHLLELLGEKEDLGNQVLIDYRETLGELLLENYAEQWTAWAHRHGSKTRNQAHGSPANLIDLYSAVDIPEIEGFGLSDFGIKGLRADSGFTRKNDSDISMLKYASSAAHITGKKLVSSETFTWLTEHFRTSLSQCKPDIDLMFASGINNMYFHGATYTPEHDAWPGWKFYASIDMSPTNSIWRDAGYLMDYISRCQSFLQMGRPDNDFLVLLPVRDMWSARNGKGAGSLLMQFDIHSMDKKAPDFIKSILEINNSGFDCDYISEKYLLTTTFVDGMLQTAAGTRYKALIIPGKLGLKKNVADHVDALRQQGAKIFYETSASELAGAAAPEAMKGKFGLSVIRRKNNTGYHYFIANLTPRDIDETIPLAVSFKDARWFDPLDGSIYRATTNGNGVEICLKSGQSMILQTYNYSIADDTRCLQKETSEVKALAGKWNLSFVESAPKVTEEFVLDRLQTWECLDNDSVRHTMGVGAYTTDFTMSKEDVGSSWSIDLGDVRESARVYINDKYVGCAWSVPYVLKCGDVFKEGKNTVRIEVTNLPANRISYLDKQGVDWRKFKEINIVNINYKKDNYANWKPVKSGLNSSVKLVRTK